MISRRITPHLNELLRHSPAVVLLGPRQAGKTTLALEIGAQTSSIYLDLEDENDRAKLANLQSESCLSRLARPQQDHRR